MSESLSPLLVSWLVLLFMITRHLWPMIVFEPTCSIYHDSITEGIFKAHEPFARQLVLSGRGVLFMSLYIPIRVHYIVTPLHSSFPESRYNVVYIDTILAQVQCLWHFTLDDPERLNTVLVVCLHTQKDSSSNGPLYAPYGYGLSIGRIGLHLLLKYNTTKR